MTSDQATDEVLLSRVIKGGYAGTVRSSCVVSADGVCVSSSGGDDSVRMLDAAELRLVEAVCAHSAARDLPDFIPWNVNRSDSMTWTYTLGGHEVRMHDVDRAGDAVPGPLHVLNALVDALTGEGS